MCCTVLYCTVPLSLRSSILIEELSSSAGFGYPYQIHEQAEMAILNMGQYEHNNQPVHHELYMFALAGEPNSTQYWVRQTMKRAYSPSSYSGDEDNGEMGAWFVFSALGFYPIAPGKSEYVLGSPLFKKMKVCLGEDDDDQVCQLDPHSSPSLVVVACL
jgi:putative alpha-1,2-mannosidase